MRLLDKYLADRAFIVADHLTVAEFRSAASTYRWYALPIERPELPNLRAWYQRLTRRPAFASTSCCRSPDQFFHYLGIGAHPVRIGRDAGVERMRRRVARVLENLVPASGPRSAV